MGRRARLFWSCRRGVTAIVLALSLTALLGFAGLAIDVSVWYADKRMAQGAADSAAYTAALTYNADGQTTAGATHAIQAATAILTQYGFTNGAGGVTVTINNPPATGSHKSSGAFEVIVQKAEDPIFSTVFGGSRTIAARAVGALTAKGQGGPACMLETGQAAYAQINISNGAAVNLNSCGVAANGSGSGALTVTGGGSLSAATAEIVGGIVTNNGGSVNISGTKLTGAASTSNPYQNDTIAAAESGYSTSGCSASSPGYSYNGGGQSYTLSPGVYCGGLSVSNGVTVTMKPGIYIVYGGVFSLQSGTVTANGVTIVLTGSGTNYAVANIANGDNFTLTAPTTGSTAGVAILGDPAAPSPTASLTGSSSCGTVSSDCSSFAGGVAMKITGAIDVPNQGVQFSNGSSNASSCTQLIAFEVAFTGGTTFNNTCSGAGTSQIGGSTSTVAVVE